MDGMDTTYNEADYKKKMSEYIKKIQDLPSKPIVMLQIPMATRLTMNNGNECIQNQNDPYFPAQHSNCTLLSMLDMQHVFYEIANLTGIPEHHVVNGWALMRLNPDIKARDLMAPDNVHP